MDIVSSLINKFSNLDIKIIDKKQNEGSAAARQSGLDIASGEYVIYIDSDDWCEPTMLEDTYKFAISNCADIVVCDFFVSYPHRELYHSQNINNIPLEFIDRMFRGVVYPAIWSKLIKRSLFSVNNIKWVYGINMAEDKIICTKLFSVAVKVCHLHKAYVHYVQNPISMTQNRSSKSLQDSIDAIQEIESYLKSKDLLNQLSPSLLYSKLTVKLCLLTNSKGMKQREFAKIYPEANKSIWSHPNLSIPYKIAVYLAINRCLLFSNVIFRTLSRIKKLL